MIRHVAAVAVMLCVSASWVSAQTIEFTVNTASAQVHKGPSIGSPVIGKAPRGAVLEVTRELGDWVKVDWPSVPDSAGYIRLTAGSIRRAMPGENGRPARTMTRPISASGYAPLDARAEYAGSVDQSSRSVFVNPRTHTFGVGGLMSGATVGYGASGRAWSQGNLGLQVQVSRSALTSDVTAGRVTAVEFAPSVLYSLRDRVTDYVWLRPYVGGGVNLNRASQTGYGSSNKVGFQAFGGSEFTFASFPRVSLSADLTYRKTTTPFEGFEFGGLGFAVAGHWYVK
jgi:hypothetical protein